MNTVTNFKTLEFILNNIDEEVIKEKIFVMSSQRILDAGKDIQKDRLKLFRWFE